MMKSIVLISIIIRREDTPRNWPEAQEIKQGFTRVPQATVARDGTVSPAAGGIYFGSHCRGNGIPRSLFSAPVGRGINGSYKSDGRWERDGNCYMRGMGTGVVGFYMEREFQTT